MTNYYSQRRQIRETVLVGDKAITVEVDWKWVEDDEKIDVTIVIDGIHRNTWKDVSGDALTAFANVFLTAEALLQHESVEAKR